MGAPSVEEASLTLRRRARAALDRLRAAWRRLRPSRSRPPRNVRAAPPPPPEQPPAGTVLADRDDDLASVIGRIDTAEEIDLVLVVPRAARHLRSAGVWPRLAAHVRRRGISLGVVASRREVRQHARASGLRAEASLRALRRSSRMHVAVGAREFDLPALRVWPLMRWVVLLALIGAAVGGACYVVPTAEIVVVPPGEPITRSARVLVSAAAAEPDVAGGVVPGVTVRRTITTTLATDTTGTTEIGDRSAKVELTLHNAGAAAAAVSAATRAVTAGGVSFLLDGPLTVPAGESRTVDATAEFPGEPGNVEAGEIDSLPGFAPSLTVTNVDPAAGGTNVTVAAVAAEDVDRLREIAPAALARVAARALEENAGDGTVFPQTINVAIFSETPLARPGDPADVFLMDYTAVVTALVLPAEQARAYGRALLIDGLAEDRALLPGTVVVQTAGASSAEDGKLAVDLAATALAAPLFDPAEIGEGLAGERPAEAAAQLRRRLALQEEPSITLSPGWVPWRRLPCYPDFAPWSWLPCRGSRISIIFAGPPLPEESPQP